MSPKLTRLLFVATLATGFSAPMLVASAAAQPRSVDAYNMPKGFYLLGSQPSNRLEVNAGDPVSWNIIEGEHTITPQNEKQWGDDGSDTLNEDSTERYTAKNFKLAGQDYFYYCKIHGSLDGIGKPDSMWGVVHVKDDAPPPPPPPPPPPTDTSSTTTTTSTTRPAATPPATTATAPTTRPTPTTAAPTTTAPKGDKDKKQKDDETTTTTLPPPPPPIDLPDEAIVPSLPGSTTSSAEPGAPGEAPLDTPEGEAVALLKGKKSGGEAMKLLIVSGLGLGALGVGTAGYKYANRSSKYFPA